MLTFLAYWTFDQITSMSKKDQKKWSFTLNFIIQFYFIPKQNIFVLHHSLSVSTHTTRITHCCGMTVRKCSLIFPMHPYRISMRSYVDNNSVISKSRAWCVCMLAIPFSITFFSYWDDDLPWKYCWKRKRKTNISDSSLATQDKISN